MSQRVTARDVIAALQLEPLPGEGGFFRQTHRRTHASAIYFLMTERDFSALHRIAQDEVWHFHAGDRVQHVQLLAPDQTHVARLGPNVLAGEQPQLLVPAGTWQGARLDPTAAATSGFALLGCTVSPPWDERGFELGSRDALLREFPGATELVRALTR